MQGRLEYASSAEPEWKVFFDPPVARKGALVGCLRYIRVQFWFNFNSAILLICKNLLLPSNGELDIESSGSSFRLSRN